MDLKRLFKFAIACLIGSAMLYALLSYAHKGPKISEKSIEQAEKIVRSKFCKNSSSCMESNRERILACIGPSLKKVSGSIWFQMIDPDLYVKCYKKAKPK